MVSDFNHEQSARDPITLGTCFEIDKIAREMNPTAPSPALQEKAG